MNFIFTLGVHPATLSPTTNSPECRMNVMLSDIFWKCCSEFNC